MPWLWDRVLHVLLAFSVFLAFAAPTLAPCRTRARTACVVGSCIRRHGNSAILATTLDALVAVFVKGGEVVPEFLVLRRNVVAFMYRGKASGESLQRFGVEFVLMGLSEAG